MPNTNTAKKRLRQNVVHRLRNRSIKSAIKTSLRQVHAALTDGNVEQSETLYRLAVKNIDRAAARHIIHSNRAGRIKSRLQRRILSAKQA